MGRRYFQNQQDFKREFDEIIDIESLTKAYFKWFTDDYLSLID